MPCEVRYFAVLVTTLNLILILIKLMNYDIDERQTSLDNMEDTLFEKMKFAFVRENVGDAEAIKNEWVVNDDDEPDNFLFVPNLTLD